MSNNINNLNGFNAINFSGKSEKKPEAPKCDCPDCREAEGSSLEALAASGQAQVKGPYKFNPDDVKADVREFELLAAQAQDEALDIAFKGLNDFALNKFGA